MVGKRRRQFKIWLNRFLRQEGIKLLLYIVILCTIFFLLRGFNFTEDTYKILFSFVFSAALIGLANLLSTLVSNKIEDGVKLSEDYEDVMNTYSREHLLLAENDKEAFDYIEKKVSEIRRNRKGKKPVRYKAIRKEVPEDKKRVLRNIGVFARKHRIKEIGDVQKEVRLPATEEGSVIISPEVRYVFNGIEQSRNAIPDTVYEPIKEYKFPEYIEKHYNELFSAHQTSIHEKNQMLLRVDDWNISEGKCEITFGLTNVFNSLVTNRAVDYRLEGGASVRERYEPGPTLTPLKFSHLSNNLGGEGFLITEDGWIPLRVNNSWTIVGKKAIGTSLSFKSFGEELLDNEEQPAGSTSDSKDKATRPIFGRVCRNLIDISVQNTTLLWLFRNHRNDKKYFDLQSGKCSECQHKCRIGAFDPRKVCTFLRDNVNQVRVIGFYRDLVEGGKPEAVVLAHTPLNRAALEKEIKASNSRKCEKDRKLRFRKVVWIYVGEDKSILEKEDTLEQMYIDEDSLVFNGKHYQMFHHATTSLEILRRFRKKYPEEFRNCYLK